MSSFNDGRLGRQLAGLCRDHPPNVVLDRRGVTVVDDPDLESE